LLRSAQLAQKEKFVSVSVSDNAFIDRSEVRSPTVTPIDGLFQPRSSTMIGTDHTAAFRIDAQRIGGEGFSFVVTGEWKSMTGGTFYFSPSGVLQNANRTGTAPNFVVSSNLSLRALAGQLVTELTTPSETIVNSYRS
jgi:hypothetical protein